MKNAAGIRREIAAETEKMKYLAKEYECARLLYDKMKAALDNHQMYISELERECALTSSNIEALTYLVMTDDEKKEYKNITSASGAQCVARPADL